MEVEGQGWRWRWSGRDGGGGGGAGMEVEEADRRDQLVVELLVVLVMSFQNIGGLARAGKVILAGQTAQTKKRERNTGKKSLNSKVYVNHTNFPI